MGSPKKVIAFDQSWIDILGLDKLPSTSAFEIKKLSENYFSDSLFLFFILSTIAVLLSIIPFWQIIKPTKTYQKQNQGGNKCRDENFSIII